RAGAYCDACRGTRRGCREDGARVTGQCTTGTACLQGAGTECWIHGSRYCPAFHSRDDRYTACERRGAGRLAGVPGEKKSKVGFMRLTISYVPVIEQFLS